MTAPVNAFDLHGLAALKRDAKVQDPAALKEAAKQFESLFTKMLLQSMREASKSFGGDSLFGSDQADFYQQMFDDQMAVQLSQGKGLGLADMLIRQLAQGQEGDRGQGTGDSGFGVNGGRRTADGEKTAALSTPLPWGEVASSAGEGARGIARSEDSPLTTHNPLAKRDLRSTPLAQTRAEFVQQMRPFAESAARKLGVDPDALIAQAALETGWGKSVPCTNDGACSFNLFGVKAGASWSGATANVSTLEFEDGVAVRKVERFRAYDSPEASFMDYARLVGGAARYRDARGAGEDIASFAQALQRGGYATDPNYAQKIVSVAAEVRALRSGGDAA